MPSIDVPAEFVVIRRCICEYRRVPAPGPGLSVKIAGVPSQTMV
jgi:GMP synthase PP-ATPase subunit